jgi:hypothetical protein
MQSKNKDKTFTSDKKRTHTSVGSEFIAKLGPVKRSKAIRATHVEDTVENIPNESQPTAPSNVISLLKGWFHSSIKVTSYSKNLDIASLFLKYLNQSFSRFFFRLSRSIRHAL